ncbi:hypothetical protein Gotur_022577 [Gossypium turneri]
MDFCPYVRISVWIDFASAMEYGPEIDHGKINEWILYAVRHGVRELDLIFQRGTFETRHFTDLEFGVFTCKTLLTLRLFNLPSLVLTIPTHCCLPNLKGLHLTFLKFSDDESIRRLLSSCNSLEELLVQSFELSNLKKLSVCHPTFKGLTISGGYIAPSLKWRLTPRIWSSLISAASAVKKQGSH